MGNYNIEQLNESVRQELYYNILPFWIRQSRDTENGGFYGRITNDLRIDVDAPKSQVQVTRILWTFSAMQQFNPKREYMEMADWAYQYLRNKYFDPQFGGVFWLLDYKGNVIDDKKKIYGQAFSIYALSEYFKATRLPEALSCAKSIFHLIEKNNYDIKNKGYYEISNRDWTLSENSRLSDKDLNEKKSMNTHLHLMEAYTTLYQVWPDKTLALKLRELIDDFLQFIIDPATHHFRLFFDESWEPKSINISFGHDIEGSWLLCEAAEVLGDQELIKIIKNKALDIVNVTIQEGCSKRYSIIQEKYSDGTSDHSVHWWQQAEALVGLVNAFQISNDEPYLQLAFNYWQFIEEYLIDKRYGEWFYEINPDGCPNHNRDKVSEWKGPYHNGRACMEVLKRLGN